MDHRVHLYDSSAEYRHALSRPCDLWALRRYGFVHRARLSVRDCTQGDPWSGCLAAAVGYYVGNSDVSLVVPCVYSVLSADRLLFTANTSSSLVRRMGPVAVQRMSTSPQRLSVSHGVSRSSRPSFSSLVYSSSPTAPDGLPPRTAGKRPSRFSRIFMERVMSTTPRCLRSTVKSKRRCGLSGNTRRRLIRLLLLRGCGSVFSWG